jgi:abequosyltransferase
MPATVLSICIPTYNFGDFIGETVRSIVAQASDGVEIVVLDGGSTDNTAEVVQSFQHAGARVKYHRQPVRGGIDRDIARTVELAEGLYCWLFSADDVMRSGSIATVLAWINSGRDLYLCRHSVCKVDMTLVGEHPVLCSDEPMAVDLGNPAEQIGYFARALTTEAFFSFMGTLIVRRSVWQSVPLNEKFVGGCWAHVARLFEVMPRGLRLTYYPDVLLDRRGDNDSFADRGVVNRYRIAIEGYHRIADTFLGTDTVLAFHVRRVVRNEYGLRQFLAAAIRCRQSPQSESAALLNELLLRAYRDVPWRSRLIGLAIALVPTAMYTRLKAMYRRARDSRSVS